METHKRWPTTREISIAQGPALDAWGERIGVERWSPGHGSTYAEVDESYRKKLLARARLGPNYRMMTADGRVELANGLRKRAGDCETLGEGHSDPVDRARVMGKAAAYRHAAELVESVT